MESQIFRFGRQKITTKTKIYLYSGQSGLSGRSGQSGQNGD